MFVNPPQEMCQSRMESLKKVDLGKLRTIVDNLLILHDNQSWADSKLK